MVDVTELARKALLEVTPESTVGQPVGTVDEGDGVVSVQFSNRMPGYPGWRWTVSIAQVEGDEPTVLEVELLPGDGSLLAPEWVPWSERLAEYRAGHDDAEAESDEDDDESDEDDDDEDADYEDPDDDEADDDESDDDDAFGDEDEDDLEESDDDELDGVDVDAADEDDEDEDEEPAPLRSRGARRRAARVRPVDPDDDLELDRLDPTEVDPDRHA
ncbi:DUF3027 domain-containing protein [Curtobacterium sp. Csp1]|uniref:DUF3027 domain-containing protein n=1 Tax=unclassified Curtobacterium TaxID=257496 RepID=UPI001599CAA2|nr:MULTISPECIES: DUF3027 domain-containing protein [unclassified Curtobacterium]QKS13189.1 DUF3027 domain-containing protein [Curtobacterium sp. csp3]QKS19412.1 DUF3027 domain-containing protein [Curtobacterium sp. Csp1]